ncbi:glycoside hydrolase family 15 protein [Fodinicola acaciae]|uniref:glycoside hydrolase family 15 protein n=1 Tax=Fodinicola acaciae TaxID=2681555 RepID=UPI001FEC84CA|nr:glycoside hydrolase family 15 protein [Fodinicola acaciae]
MSSPYVLREYSLVADGERGALCGPDGNISWLCVPSWHDDAVFADLIGGDGRYAVTPVERYVWGGYYEPATLIWRHSWVTIDNRVVECRDAMAAPADPRYAVLLRQISGSGGTVEITLDLRGRFGAERMSELRQDDSGRWTGRSGSLRFRWSGADDAVVTDSGELSARWRLEPGQTRDLVLEIGRTLPDEPTDASQAWTATGVYWENSMPSLHATVAPRDARHSYAVLRGLTTSGGGMVAAATMSLPERAEMGRNFDYRYCWIRDQCYAGIAAQVAGATDLVDAAVSFVSERLIADGASMSPAYQIDGEPIPSQRSLELAGYPGGFDVIGNQVNKQLQLDAFGEALQLLSAAVDRLDTDGWRALSVAVDAIDRHWPQPEAGIWELHDDFWTHSRLSCVAGLRAAARIAPVADAARFVQLAETIMAETTRRCLRSDSVWQRSPSLIGTDASLVMPSVRGALPADDPRTRNTLAAVRGELASDGYVYRYAHGNHPLGEIEGAFLLCGFMMALAQFDQGHHVDAFRWFERTRSACGPPALFAEEYDVRQRQLRGNLPQAFVHAALLETASRLADA